MVDTIINNRNEPVAYGHCETSKHGICWASIIAGSVGAIAVSFALLVLASSYGLAISSPWSGEGFSATAVGVNAIIAMIIIQWVSSAFGGFLTGRLRTSWRVHTDEVCFRDTAHGFLTWAVATLVTVLILGHAVTAVVGGGAKAITAGAVASSDTSSNDPMAYSIDTLFRSERPATTDTSSTATRAEVTRIFAKSMTEENMSESDKAYLSSVVANRAGISQAEASARIDNTVKEIKKGADTARKTASTIAIFTFLSLVIGAFIAAVAGALGGRCRDDLPLVK